ncbi:hypothetical protein HISP_18240 (plasmid) [Haloarcula hispanica N601]|uniref:UPF0033 domain-containing protein n=3 Tax=Haloarcula hispanica TaxID=51589 RepID=V5TRW2_HALHI|nr:MULTISPECIES: sulfurtransferase TusA family protein [Haloarcula]AHB68021.1 hypothetical protein HISP_18240 [Haloarcula hispanica N601]AJF27655.1 hypothetical protein SG26_17990 [Haloarcula sp. CBA1115]KAA9404373.1 hypothetical protein Har1131_16415 [Haloarcula sp. CBA1131]MCJ0621245.1 hypothetical protein [Haloarcula hispanica]MUV49331.1 hypothetical protein [Haloarcula sp. CBA1122]
MANHEPTQMLGVTGENCPMPVVKAKQTIDELSSGEKASTDVLKHYVRTTMTTGPQQAATADILPDYDWRNSDNSVDSALAAQHTTDSNLQSLIFHS